MTNNGIKRVGRAVRCPPNAWVASRHAHGVTRPAQIVCPAGCVTVTNIAADPAERFNPFEIVW
jgi:hypothetical protein